MSLWQALSVYIIDFRLVGKSGYVTHVPAIGTLFLLLGCHIQIQYLSFCYLLEAYSVQIRHIKGVDVKGRGGWKKLGRLEGRENNLTYCMRKESIFN